MRRTRYGACLILLLCAGCASQVSPPPTARLAAVSVGAFHNRLARAKDLFYSAISGDRQALGSAERILEDLGGGQSRNAQVVAYLGACKLLEAAHTPLIWDKAALGRDGLALEDRAVAQAPGDLEVRMLRGVTEYQLPDFLNRKALSTRDLAMVAKVAEQAVSNGRLDPRAASADLDYHGKALEENYDAAGAIRAWRAAIRLSPASSAARDARKHLAEHHVSARDLVSAAAE